MERLNECLDCGHTSEKALWVFNFKNKNNEEVTEEVLVELGDDIIDGMLAFDLDDIDCEEIALKHNADPEEVSDSLTSYCDSICPNCKSTFYYHVEEDYSL